VSWKSAIGKTFKLPFMRGTYLTIKLENGLTMPSDWRKRALQMFCGQRPADAEFLARAWFYEQMQSQKVERNRCVEVGQLQRKLTALRTELRGRNSVRTGGVGRG